ncbi:hypothetical protein QTI66_37495 [Variovorax sp. J22R133]|uniref:hypothetical protein n=1 Tax=Variovorax brevis TaxID=3053503 RepID=UPI00257778F5|nr:hypothetical protein [Variovorax sp. J22R133]MDM0117794.1 hypothetical protein [Variovorax sp. J22R133]
MVGAATLAVILLLKGHKRLPGVHDITRDPDARRIPGLVLFRWHVRLFFANEKLFQSRLLDAVAASPTPFAGWSLRPNLSRAGT